MIDVDLDFIIKGIESQGATCIVKPRRDWNNGKLPYVFWFVEPGNTLNIIGDGMYI